MPEIEFKVKNMVKTYQGTIPICLHAVMAGENKYLGFLPETVLPYLTHVGNLRDTDLRALDLTNGLAQQIRKLTNEDPYRVEFLGDRLYIDVNREKMWL